MGTADPSRPDGGAGPGLDDLRALRAAGGKLEGAQPPQARTPFASPDPGDAGGQQENPPRLAPERKHGQRPWGRGLSRRGPPSSSPSHKGADRARRLGFLHLRLPHAPGGPRPEVRRGRADAAAHPQGDRRPAGLAPLRTGCGGSRGRSRSKGASASASPPPASGGRASPSPTPRARRSRRSARSRRRTACPTSSGPRPRSASTPRPRPAPTSASSSSSAGTSSSSTTRTPPPPRLPSPSPAEAPRAMREVADPARPAACYRPPPA